MSDGGAVFNPFSARRTRFGGGGVARIAGTGHYTGEYLTTASGPDVLSILLSECEVHNKMRIISNISRMREPRYLLMLHPSFPPALVLVQSLPFDGSGPDSLGPSRWGTVGDVL